ncbi:MAG TPA: methyl-accepting chemotaxis protein, partial [Anaerolineae bacterium]|nr:methyl-accepting chemotaxis protein [Anaerolineae bacterium]
EENSASLQEVSAATEEMSAQVEEVSASAEALREMAQRLQELVSQFKLTEINPERGYLPQPAAYLRPRHDDQPWFEPVLVNGSRYSSN